MLLSWDEVGVDLAVIVEPLSFNRCARLEFEFGDVDRAIKLVEEQLAAHPQKKTIYTNYIQLLISAGKSAEAE